MAAKAWHDWRGVMENIEDRRQYLAISLALLSELAAALAKISAICISITRGNGGLQHHLDVGACRMIRQL